MQNDARHMHQMEQALAAVRDTAELVGRYFRALVEQGFSREEALTLTVDYQRMLTQIGALRALTAQQQQEGM